METIVLEHCFSESAFDIGRYKKAQSDNEWCLNLHGVRHVRSYVSPDGRRMVCIFEAPDAEAVRRMSVQLGYSYDQIWRATIVE
jgi:uncharacterized protein with GYD domain